MLKLLASVDSVRKKLDEVMIRRAVRQYLSATIRESEVDYLVGTATIKKYATNDYLFKEGDAADGLYMIRRGSVMVSRQVGGKEIVLSYVAAGNYVGEMALLSAAPRSATIKAAVPTEVIMLEAKRFNEVMSSHSTVRATVDNRSMERMKTNQAMESGESGSIISFLMKQGLGEATDVLLIDEGLCVRCNNCEKACAETHGGTSRLNREAGRPPRTNPRADVMPPLRAPALHEGLPAGCHPSFLRRRSVHRGHLHRLRQLPEELPLWRDPDGAGGGQEERFVAGLVAAVRPRPQTRPHHQDLR